MQREVNNHDLMLKIELLEFSVKNILTKQEEDRENIKQMLNAFHAANGAFQVLEWVARIAKPILFITGLVTAATLWFKGTKL